jgi:hypothetical protein
MLHVTCVYYLLLLMLCATGNLLCVIGKVVPYQSHPFKLCQLIDSSVPRATQVEIATAIFSLPPCCLDPGMSRRIVSMVPQPSVDDLLEGGALFKPLTMSFILKVVNVQVEDVFARASSMRQTSRGKCCTQASQAGKHILAELKSRHVDEVFKSEQRGAAVQASTEISLLVPGVWQDAAGGACVPDLQPLQDASSIPGGGSALPLLDDRVAPNLAVAAAMAPAVQGANRRCSIGSAGVLPKPKKLTGFSIFMKERVRLSLETYNIHV